MILILLLSCGDPEAWDCLKTAGKTKSEFRETGKFNKIFVYDKLDTELIQSDYYGVEIKAGENLIPGIETDSDGETIRISNKNTCELLRNSDKRPLVKVYFDTIENLQVFSSGYVISTDTIRLDKLLLSKRSNGDMILNLNCGHVFIYSNEYGDAVFFGSSNTISVKQEGVGLVDFANLKCNSAYVETRGPGTTTVNAMTEVTGIVHGNGRLIILGDPDNTNVVVSDNGELIFGRP